MKLLTYCKDGIEAVGVLTADCTGVYPIKQLGLPFETMQELIERGTYVQLAQLKQAVEDAAAPSLPLSTLERRAPIPRLRRDMICIGFNFRSHAEEIARLRGEPVNTANVSKPIYFCKRTLRATADGDPIPYIKGYAENLDVGVEVCVIIGKDVRDITPEQVGDSIFGYSIANDVCDTRINKAYTQPFLGKSLDGYMPVGPWIVTPDEFAAEPLFDLTLTVNDNIRQQGNTAGLVFDIPYIISELSQNMTLKAGTMVSTGSPANFDAGSPEKLLLLPGDVIRCEIGGIGVLTNVVKEVTL